MTVPEVEAVVAKLPAGQQAVYRSLAARALSLGYQVRKDRTKNPGCSFFSRRYGETVLRLIDDGKRIHIRIKFYGVADHPPAFGEALRNTLEDHGFRYVGCYGCGRCPGDPVGYRVRYPDGREYFRCGFELIPFFGLDPATEPQALALLEAQTAFWEARLTSRGAGDHPALGAAGQAPEAPADRRPAQRF